MAQNTARYQAVQNKMTRVFNMQVRRATPFYPQLCTVVPSTHKDESYGFLGNMPGVREWLGDREFEDLRASEFEVQNKHWESSLQLEKTDVDDDRVGLFPMSMRELADEASYHPDELLFHNVINQAESLECIDGQNFFDTDHLWGDSGSQSNLMTETVASTTVTNGESAVTPAEIRSVVHRAIKRMFTFKRDNGKFFRRPVVGPLGNVLVVVPLCMQEAAHQAYDQRTLATGEDNFYLERPTIVTAQYFGSDSVNPGGSDTRIDVYHTGGMLKPFVFQARSPIRIQSKGADDIEFKYIKWMTEARYNVGVMAWWEAVRVNLST